jgi:tetratricopeptide (TPR) repeat protein
MKVGHNYYYMFDYAEALNQFMEAYQIALRTSNTVAEIRILTRISFLYKDQKYYDRAEEFLRKSYDLAVKHNDPMHIGWVAVNFVDFLIVSGRYDEAGRYLDIAYGALKDRDPLGMLLADINKVELLYCTKNYAAARRVALSTIEPLRKHGDPRFLVNIYQHLAKIGLEEHNDKETLHFACEALANDPNYEEQIKIYSTLSHLYYRRDAFDEAFRYNDSVLIATTNLYKQREEKNFMLGKIKLELLSYQNQLANSRRKQLTGLYGLGVALLLLALLTVILIISRRENKQKKIIYERNSRIAELELAEEKNARQNLQTTIETKNRELTATALQNSTRNQMLEDLVDSILKETGSARNDGIRKSLHRIKRQLCNAHEEDHFLTHFEEVNPNFVKALKSRHPYLSAGDIKYLSYVYINLSTKEISSILNITQDSCKKKRTRLRTKMGIEPDVDLYDYLATL